MKKGNSISKFFGFIFPIFVAMSHFDSPATALSTPKLLQMASERFTNDLSFAETEVIKSIANGIDVQYVRDPLFGSAQTNLQRADVKRTIRADRLEWLLMQSANLPTSSHQGIVIGGFKIEGLLDLRSTKILVPLFFRNCVFTDQILLSQSHLVSLDLTGAFVQGINADGCHIESDFLMCNGFKAVEGVNLRNSVIGGLLYCDSGSFSSTEANTAALNADGATIGGSVFMSGMFHSQGEVRFIGAKVQGNFECQGAHFVNTQGFALLLAGTDIAGNVFFSEGFQAEGEVSITGSTIGKSLQCENGHFLNRRGFSFSADMANIIGIVSLRQGFSAIGEVRFVHAKVGDIQCDGGHFANLVDAGFALNLEQAEVVGNVMLTKAFRAIGEVRLLSAKIGGDLECIDAIFSNPKHIALEADGISIGHNVHLSGAFVAEGSVKFISATIGKNFVSMEGHFVNPQDDALVASEIKVADSLYLGRGFNAEGQLRLPGARIGGDFICNGTLSTKLDTALFADGINVGGGIDFGSNFNAHGEVRLPRATIGTDLQCVGSHFYNSNSSALDFSKARIGGQVSLSKGFIAEGEVQFPAAILGSLDCEDGVFSNPEAVAIFADGTKIDGNVTFSGKFRAEGQVRLVRATIGDNLECNMGQFIYPNESALFADGAKINGSVQLRNSKVNGEVRLIGTTIGSNVECDGGEFFNPNSVAVLLTSAKVGGSVNLRDGFKSAGEVNLGGASIGGNLNCSSASIFRTNLNEAALSVFGATVQGSVALDGTFECNGKMDFVNVKINHFLVMKSFHASTNMILDLRSAKAGGLYDDTNCWPLVGNLFLDNFVYDDIYNLSPSDAETRMRWLRLQPTQQFLSQPYEQLATVLKKIGRGEESAKIMVEKNRDYARRLHWFSVSQLWYSFTGWFAGYGYLPGRAFKISIAFVAFGWCVFSWGYKEGIISPKDLTRAYPSTSSEAKGALSEDYPAFNALIFSLENFVPLLSLEMGQDWKPNPKRGKKINFIKSKPCTTGNLLQIYFWLHIVLGWVLTTLWVGALAGLVKT